MVWIEHVCSRIQGLASCVLVKAAALNTTAYRVFKMIQWLSEGPQSVHELNQRFLEDPLVSRTVSEDSIWLYINTLKMIGCEITRPTPSNGFRYTLCYHPFGIALTNDDIDTLIRAKNQIGQKIGYPDILHLDRFIKTVIHHSTLLNRRQKIDTLFRVNRSVDYEQQTEMIKNLHEAVAGNNLLFVHYRSPAKGLECFYFLPEELLYRTGALYLAGNRLGREQQVKLRVDRIEVADLATEPTIYDQLVKMRCYKVQTVVRLYQMFPVTSTEILCRGEQVRYVDDADPPYMEVILETRDHFFLKQRLLSLGLPFQVMAPEEFRTDVLETLKSMEYLYREPCHG